MGFVAVCISADEKSISVGEVKAHGFNSHGQTYEYWKFRDEFGTLVINERTFFFLSDFLHIASSIGDIYYVLDIDPAWPDSCI